MRGRGQFASAEARWAGLGPYYAMFPMEFAESVITRHAPSGGLVLDPFAGRGTAIYAAGRNGRRGLGIELNPVGWLYARAKLRPAERWDVLCRLVDVSNIAHHLSDECSDLPEFFSHCFSPPVLRFLVAARKELRWSTVSADATLMAFILQDLHGNRGRALSNQLRQAKSMAPEYSVRWWKARKMRPPNIDPREHLAKKIEWRYKFGAPYLANCRVLLGDSVRRLPMLSRIAGKVDLLLTSPPYMGVTDYHYDQWLRFWMLGGPDWPKHRSDTTNRGDFQNEDLYRKMLETVFESSARLLKSEATVYVRTDARKRTLELTVDVLGDLFGHSRIRKASRPFTRCTQTKLFGDIGPKPGEVDICFSVAKLHAVHRRSGASQHPPNRTRRRSDSYKP